MEVKQQRLELLQARLNAQARAISESHGRQPAARAGRAARQAQSASSWPGAPTTTAGSISTAPMRAGCADRPLCRRAHHRGDAQFAARAPGRGKRRVSSVPAPAMSYLDPADNVRLVELCGPLDAHLRLIETRLIVEIRRRGNRFQIVGAPLAARQAEVVLLDLYARAQREPVDSERVHIALQAVAMDEDGADAAQAERAAMNSRCVPRAVRCAHAAPISRIPRQHPHA